MTAFALVDANNFYATCEQIFQPALRHRPLVVLSNNDGCIVARSAEAKALGIPMGAPVHEWRSFCRQHQVVICSSNYTLYGDMSARMLQVLHELCPRVDSYSIDESFLDLTEFPDLTAYGQMIRQTVQKRTHITCGVGIGPTKTLAKFANLLAKKQPVWSGVCSLMDPFSAIATEAMQAFSVDEVWGVGRRLAARLQAEGIATVCDLRDADADRLRTRYGVVMEKTVRELQGLACLTLEEVGRPKAQIMASRSFGTVITALPPIRAAVAHHVARAAEKLRAQEGQAQLVYVMLRTNPFRTQDIPYRKTFLVPLAQPTSDTAVLQAAAFAGLSEIYRPGLNYHKVGVMLGEITDAREVQADLFAPAPDPKRLQLMQLMDRINQQQGRGTLRFASTECEGRWQMRTAHRSPQYTTCWAELPVAYCC